MWTHVEIFLRLDDLYYFEPVESHQQCSFTSLFYSGLAV